MRILEIEKMGENDNYYYTEITFKPLFRKPFTAKCVTEKLSKNILSSTFFYDTGYSIPLMLQKSVEAFLKSNQIKLSSFRG